jgi:hypothetical protein
VFTSASLTVSSELLGDTNWSQLDVKPGSSTSSPYTPSQLCEASSPFSRSLRDFLERLLYLPANRSAGFGPERAFEELSQAQTSSITGLLLRLNTVNRPAFEEISTGLGLVFPEVRSLKFGGLGNTLVPEIEFDDGRTEQVANMGFGFQNTLQLLTVFAMAKPNSIILIDEPEKGLNQSSQRDLAALLDVLRPDVTLVVSTQAEAFCRGFSTSSSIVLVEANGNSARTSKIDITNHEDLRRLAHALGLDPIYLSEGGRIVYVEGVSDQLIIEQWLRLHLPNVSGYQVVSLGGCGKISEEFVKPLLVAYRDRVFLLLDSDRSSSAERRSPAIDKLAGWLTSNTVAHYILERREIENYIGADEIARAAGLHPSAISAAPGTEDWHDIKEAFVRVRGHQYDERRLSVAAFGALDGKRKQGLLGAETVALLSKTRAFLGG